MQVVEDIVEMVLEEFYEYIQVRPVRGNKTIFEVSQGSFKIVAHEFEGKTRVWSTATIPPALKQSLDDNLRSAKVPQWEIESDDNYGYDPEYLVQPIKPEYYTKDRFPPPDGSVTSEDNFGDWMRECCYRTYTTGHEAGFIVDGNDKVVGVYDGNRTSVTHPHPQGGMASFSFHTHPSTFPELLPSDADMRSMYDWFRYPSGYGIIGVDAFSADEYPYIYFDIGEFNSPMTEQEIQDWVIQFQKDVIQFHESGKVESRKGLPIGTALEGMDEVSLQPDAIQNLVTDSWVWEFSEEYKQFQLDPRLPTLDLHYEFGWLDMGNWEQRRKALGT